ncbi:Zinc transporter 9 [Cricetulus griseus]|uniref:Zinc transporter 9 n=1 Tax=Cricetulus griseus TaxID=10029 RepID=G3ILQ4_CRIGR|nr:Zinc transporter 9 [Cricetulus griseus]
MFPGLAAAAVHRCSWATLCRLGGSRAVACGCSHRRKNLMTFGSFTYMVPNGYPHVCTLNRVRLYSTDVHNGGQGPQAPRAEKVPAPKEAAENIGAELKAPLKQDPLQVRVKAVLKKRKYGSKYTKNNFITGVRVINEFYLKSTDLEQLRKIRRRSPHDDTVFLRSDVEAKALEVWGSLEALAREKKLHKEAEIEYREWLFRNQKNIKRIWSDNLQSEQEQATTQDESLLQTELLQQEH